MKKQLALWGAALLLLGLTACGTRTPAEQSTPYVGYTTDADVFLELPNLRQYGDYSCGTTCVQMVMNWLYPQAGDKNLTAYEEALGTTREDGTPPESILQYFADNGVEAEAARDRTIQDLVEALDNGHPMVLCLQAWTDAPDGSFNVTDPTDPDTYFTCGHWVICVGYQKTREGYRFFFNDPACVGHALLEEEELEVRWTDLDADGQELRHYGIEISGRTDYDPDGVFHMD